MMLVFVELPDMEEKRMNDNKILTPKEVEALNAKLLDEINQLKNDISTSSNRVEQLENIIKHPESCSDVDEITKARNEKQILEDKIRIYQGKLCKIQTPESNSPYYCSIQNARVSLQDQYEKEVSKLAEKLKSITEKYEKEDSSLVGIFETRKKLQPNTTNRVSVPNLYNQKVFYNTWHYVNNLNK